MVTCSDDIYIYLFYAAMSTSSDLDVTERQFFAKPRRRKGTDFILFSVFVLFLFHGRFRTRKPPC